MGAQFVVPGFVTVHLAQPVLGAMLRQPRCGTNMPDVYRVPGHVSGHVRCGDPPGSFLFRAVLRDRLTKKLILVLRGTPSAVDVKVKASSAARVAASRRAASSSGSRLDTPGYSLANTVTPSGRVPSASLFVPPLSPRRLSLSGGDGGPD